VRRPLCLALVFVGIAAVVYGVASVTGAWLGRPPWWWHPVEGTYWDDNPSMQGVGREWIGLGMAVLGLALAVACGPQRQGRTETQAWGAARRGSLLLGSALVVYGLASVTGVWLGMPPWWTTRTAPPELQAFRVEHAECWNSLNRFPKEATAQERLALRGERDKQIDVAQKRISELMAPIRVEIAEEGGHWLRPGREWISGRVVAVGLGLVAFGAWPRRRRPVPTP
jgi:hypothetical protein